MLQSRLPSLHELLRKEKLKRNSAPAMRCDLIHTSTVVYMFIAHCHERALWENVNVTGLMCYLSHEYLPFKRTSGRRAHKALRNEIKHK